MITPLLAAVAIASFGDVFAIDTSVEIPAAIRVSGGKWTYWSYCAVSPGGGTVAFIDPALHEVLTYDLAAQRATTAVAHTETARQASFASTEELGTFDWEAFVSRVARNGRSRDQVNVPVAIAYDRKGRLLVSDLGNRRVSIFDAGGSFAGSFLLGADDNAPSEIRTLPDGNLLCANLRLDPHGQMNGGHHCNVYSPDGAWMRSLAYTPPIAFERNLWLGVGACVDVDANGNAYVGFSVDPTIRVYDSTGRETQTFGSNPPWFVHPPALPAVLFQRENEPRGFWESWTRLIKVVHIGGGHLLRVALTNGKVAGTDKPFVIDVLSSDGSSLIPGVAADAWPVGVDRDGAIWWLTWKGDKLLRTHLAQWPTPGDDR